MALTKAVRSCRREAGFCTRCGKAPMLPGYTACGPCATKGRERQRAKRLGARVPVTMRCGVCGGVQTTTFHEDDILADCIRKTACVECRAAAMSREPVQT